MIELLKMLALITMTCDHVGLQLFPDILIFRIIGRLAMPIYAFMIAEGCRHTRNRKKYLLLLWFLLFLRNRTHPPADSTYS